MTFLTWVLLVQALTFILTREWGIHLATGSSSDTAKPIQEVYKCSCYLFITLILGCVECNGYAYTYTGSDPQSTSLISLVPPPPGRPPQSNILSK